MLIMVVTNIKVLKHYKADFLHTRLARSNMCPIIQVPVSNVPL